MAVAGEPYRVTRNGRRYYSKAHKEAVIAKCLVPGASLAAVALANGFNANLVRKWVRQRLARGARSKSTAKLLPVTVVAGDPMMPRPVSAAGCGVIELRMGRIELVIHGQVEREQLSLVLEAVVRSR
jgi:transposase